MSPSIASVVTPLSSPAVLSMAPSFPKSRDPVVSRCLASAHPPLFHAGGNALLLVLAQLFLRVELPAALRTLEQLHRYLLATSATSLLLGLRRRTVVLQRELDRHAVALLDVPERRRGEVQEHPPLGSLDEQSSLVRRHARHLARHRVAPQQRGVGRRASRRRLWRRGRGTLCDREAREQQAGRGAGEHGWQLHGIFLLCGVDHVGIRSNARASKRRARNDRKRGRRAPSREAAARFYSAVPATGCVLTG